VLIDRWYVSSSRAGGFVPSRSTRSNAGESTSFLKPSSATLLRLGGSLTSPCDNSTVHHLAHCWPSEPQPKNGRQRMAACLLAPDLQGVFAQKRTPVGERWPILPFK